MTDAAVLPAAQPEVAAAPLEIGGWETSRQARHQRRKAAERAEIGGEFEPENPERRRACLLDLHLFLATYFPHSTGRSLFSRDHDRMIDRLQGCLESGGRVLNVVYRGFAKTTITENSSLWATFRGLRKYIPIITAEKDKAKEIIDSLRHELSENELLLADFPEICKPFAALDGKSQRAASQTWNGKLTHIVMKGDTIVLPTIWIDEWNATPASGAIIRGRGVLGASRGMKYKRADGQNARPDFILFDDVQTDLTARSPQQVAKILSVIRKGILKSAGHQQSLACAMNATVIEHDDVTDQLCDAERNPAWDGQKVPMIRKWADAHETLWAEYMRIRRTYNHDLPRDQVRAAEDATEFYRGNRPAMDAGCEVSWDHCFNETELSAIQHAYNALCDDPPEVFESEYQNNPIKDTPAGLAALTASQIVKKVNGFKRREIPDATAHVVASIDVHDDLFYWGVGALELNFTGHLVDYGTFPEQRLSYFHKRQAPNNLARKYPKLAREERIATGLSALIDELCSRVWLRTDRTPTRLAKLLIDSGHEPEIVDHVIRTSPHAALLQKVRGIGVRAVDIPFSERKRKQGYAYGPNWYLQPGQRKQSSTLYVDTNHWKTFLHTRLSVSTLQPGSFSLYGTGETDHRLLADHLLAEHPVEVSAYGRTVIEWQATSKDNHWLDVCVYLQAIGARLGCATAVDLQTKKSGSRRSRAVAAAKAKGLA